MITASKKNKNKKKKASSKTASNGDSEKAPQVEKEVEGEAEEDGEPEGNEVASPNVVRLDTCFEAITQRGPKVLPFKQSTPQDAQANELLSDDRPNGHTAHTANGDIPPSGESPPEPTTQSMDDTETEPVSVPSTPNFPESADTSGRLEALSQDREALRAEVEQLRKSLEEIQSKHEEEVSSMRAELEESESARDQAQSQYQSLLGKINSIKNTLGERMAASRQELEQAKDQIDELEAQNESLKASTQSLEEDVTKLREEKEETSKKLSSVRKENEETSRELSSLRNRHNLSQQNWLSEREDLLQQNKILREEAQAAKEAMGDWEVLAMEERSIREGLADRVSELEEQLLAQKEAYERAASDRDSQSQAVEGLQRALREIQEARKVELREMVESTQGQVESLNKLVQQGEARATEAEAAREALTKEVERLMPFESQIKEKNLLIGKLRHEAIVLNDHLAKALRFLKKAKPEDNIDRYVSHPCSSAG
jgi:chromosome segregation ATPase